jgi:hypothetical protein
MRWGIIAALVLWCGVGLAEEPAADAPKEADPVQEKIDAATQRYYEAIEKIENDLCRQIDAMVESYADRGELEIVIELQNQKKQFLETGYPPAAPVFASNRRRAQIEITKAVNRMDRAYSDIVAQLTRNRDFTSATRMRDEWKEILATINPNIGDGFEAIRQAKLQKAGLAERTTEKAPIPQQTEAASTDQTVPDILKGINGQLSSEQQQAIRRLVRLDEKIAKLLANASGLLPFDNLQSAESQSLLTLLSGQGSKTIVFHQPVAVTNEMIDVLEEIVSLKQNSQHTLWFVRSTVTTPQLQKVSSLVPKINVCIDPALLSKEQRHIYSELPRGKTPQQYIYLPNNQSINSLEDISLLRIIQIFPPKKATGKYVLSFPDIVGVENIDGLIIFRNFKFIKQDIMKVIEQRSKNGFPTVFEKCQNPSGKTKEILEQQNIYFVEGFTPSLYERLVKSL